MVTGDRSKFTTSARMVHYHRCRVGTFRPTMATSRLQLRLQRLRRQRREELRRRRLRVERELRVANETLELDVALARLLKRRAQRRVNKERVAAVRRPKIRLSHKNSDWWKLLSSAQSADPSTRRGRQFRRRFRVPPSEVRWAVEKMRQSGQWAGGSDAVGMEGVPVELLVMASLQIMARAVPFDLAAEGAYASEVRISHGISAVVDKDKAKPKGSCLSFSPLQATVQRFFHVFTSVMEEEFEMNHGPPGDTESLEANLRAYAERGFPGCLGTPSALLCSVVRGHGSSRALHSQAHMVDVVVEQAALTWFTLPGTERQQN